MEAKKLKYMATLFGFELVQDGLQYTIVSRSAYDKCGYKTLNLTLIRMLL
jgi:hypothetical protein